MCITEYDEVKTMNLFREEGRTEGENRLGRLISQLLSLGRNSDAVRAATDSEYPSNCIRSSGSRNFRQRC